MTPETRQVISEWGTVFGAVKYGGYFQNGVFYKFEGLLSFENWYYSSGYGGDADKVERYARQLSKVEAQTSFFHFITSLSENEITPSENLSERKNNG